MNDDEKEKKNDAENLSDSIDSDAKKESEENLKLKKKQNEQASSDESVSRVESIDSTDSSISEDDDDVDNEEVVAVLKKEPSKSNYSVIKEICNRQTGLNNFLPRRFYSSLHVVQRLELVSKLQEHSSCVNSINFNEKGNLLASGSDDLTIAIWDWAKQKKLLSFETGHKSNVFQSKWLPLDTANYMVSSARDGQVRLIDITSKTTRKLAQHSSACHKISTHVDLPYFVLSAGQDSRVFSIDIREDTPTKLLSVRDDCGSALELFSVDVNPLKSYEFCVAGQMPKVFVYDRRKPSETLHQLCPKHLLDDSHVQITSAVYNYNGTEIIASYKNDDVYLFDVGSDQDFAHKYQGHRNNATIKNVNFYGPYSEYILSGSDCGNIFIWDKKTEAIVQWMDGDDRGIVNALEPHPHIPILATSGLDNDVKVWAPLRESASNFKQKLQMCVTRNLYARCKTRHGDNANDGNILWIMNQLQRHRNPFLLYNSSDEYDDDSSNEDNYDYDYEDSSDD